MKFAVFSDIHGNYDALCTTIEAIESLGCDLMICLGDVVGYGAEPNECCEFLRAKGVRTLAGNHDHAAIGLLNLEFFNEYARNAALWTREQLAPENVEWLRNAPFVEHYDSFVVTHSTLHSPEQFNYILTLLEAKLSFEALDKPICFMGHSHMPVAFFSTSPISYSMDTQFVLEPDQKMLLNVGSVGQPRDEIPMASFAYYDDEQRVVTIYRVKYDVRAAAQKILDAGLPEILAYRLFQGR